MIRKISNVRLIIILLVLALGYVAIRLFRDTGRSRSLRDELVEIDTAKVTRFVITRGDMEFEVGREEANNWKVSLPGLNKKVEATPSSVNSALGSLLSVEPGRVATKDPSKWKDFQVDSAGTRVRVYEGNKNSLDLVIGRFGMQGRQQFYTYVRLFDENTVYTADNFMGMSFTGSPANYRNSRFLQLTTDSVYQVNFRYPGDSSFVLSQDLTGQWFTGQTPADSTSVADFLSGLRFSSSTNYVDDIDPALFITPIYEVTLLSKGLPEAKISAYTNPKYPLVLHSTANPANYFSDENLNKKIFITQKDLIPGAK